MKTIRKISLILTLLMVGLQMDASFVSDDDLNSQENNNYVATISHNQTSSMKKQLDPAAKRVSFAEHLDDASNLDANTHANSSQSGFTDRAKDKYVEYENMLLQYNSNSQNKLSAPQFAIKIISNIHEDRRESSTPINVEEYIKIFHMLEQDTQFKTNNKSKLIIHYILTDLCRKSLQDGTLYKPYENLKNQLDLNSNDLRPIDMQPIQDLSSEKAIQLLQALLKLYSNNEAITLLLKNQMQTIQASEQNNLFNQASKFVTKTSRTTEDKKAAQKPYKLKEYADQLTKAAYFSPDMQWAVLLGVNKPFIVNIATGMVQNIPTVEEIIAADKIDKKIKIHALHTALEATNIAMVIAGLQTMYEHQTDDLVALQAILQKQKENIENKLNQIDPVLLYRSAPSFQNDLDKKKSAISLDTTKRGIATATLKNNNLTLSERPDVLNDIITHNNYKQITIYDDAANILVKECFIAQKNYVHKNSPTIAVPVTIPNNINGHDYIFDNFPNIERMCQIAKKHVADAIQTKEYQEDIADAQEQAHQFLLQVRQAIQTAVDIAHKNSNIYFKGILPTKISEHFDTMKKILLSYDEKLSKLCTDPKLGATLADKENDKTWTLTSMFLAGLAIGGAGLTTYYYGSEGLKKLGNATNSLLNFISPAAATVK